MAKPTLQCPLVANFFSEFEAGRKVWFSDQNSKFRLRYMCHSEKAMAPHSSTPAWKIPWMEEPGRLQSMGSLRVGHDWATSLSLFTFLLGEGNGNPLQCSCLENPRDSGAWWVAVYGVAQSRTRLKWLSSSSSSTDAASGKEPVCQYRRCKKCGFDPWVWKIPWRRAWHPRQYFCLENPMDRGAWRAAVHGIIESDTIEAI